MQLTPNYGRHTVAPDFGQRCASLGRRKGFHTRSRSALLLL